MKIPKRGFERSYVKPKPHKTVRTLTQEQEIEYTKLVFTPFKKDPDYGFKQFKHDVQDQHR